MRRELHFGDNLQVLRDHKIFPTESVDLIYLDPPFNSNASYNMLFKDKKGTNAEASITAFDDTWHWGISAEEAFDDVVRGDNIRASQLLKSLRSFLGDNDMMAYLAMMAARLIELRRVLTAKGSLYLHCDPTASHYLKLVLDSVFGLEQYGNEVIWKRTTAKGLAFTRLANNHDVIFRYTKSQAWTWHPIFGQYDKTYTDSFYSHTEPETGRRFGLDNLLNPNKNRPNLEYEFLGITRVWRWTKERMEKAQSEGLIHQSRVDTVPRLRRYLDEQKGLPVGSVWADVPPISSQSKERLGYPTQKPLALLERIIAASSEPNDVILDPFCGCGTAVDAAEKLGRQWIGIDITHLSIDLIERRMKDRYPELRSKGAFKVLGVPQDFESAEKLARERPDQFEKWAVTRINGARPYKLRGADGGIDGILEFKEDSKTYKRVILSVKGGKNIGVGMIRDLKGVMDREGDCEIGLFLSLYEPTQPMKTEAVNAGFYNWGERRFPRLQIITVKDLLEGRYPMLPSSVDESSTYKAALKQERDSGQTDLGV
jgi:site-specific DNA-methyltransferase (adenine-specific)